MWFPYIPSFFQSKFHIPFWGGFLSNEFLSLLWFSYIPGSFKPKFHITFWGQFLSKEKEFLSITVIPIIPVPFWLKRKELQKGNYQPRLILVNVSRLIIKGKGIPVNYRNSYNSCSFLDETKETSKRKLST